jgi:mannose-6-phosphate isomerase-like protein (cupin superfamily)
MKIIRSKEFTADHPWGALDIANMNGITTRLHWTDQPYKWHINDGEEIFAVLDGRVEMKYRVNGQETSVTLETGDIFLHPLALNMSPTQLVKRAYLWLKKQVAFSDGSLDSKGMMVTN